MIRNAMDKVTISALRQTQKTKMSATRVLGLTTWNMVSASRLTPKLVNITDTGKMVREMAKVLWPMSIKTSILATGPMERKMVRAPTSSSRQERNSLAFSKTVRSPKASGCIPTDPASRVTSDLTSLRVLVHGTSLMETRSKETTLRLDVLMSMVTRLSSHGEHSVISQSDHAARCISLQTSAAFCKFFL